VPQLPPRQPPSLPKTTALQLAKLANVPTRYRNLFCELLCQSLLEVWKRDRRAVSAKPGRALLRAAKAAQVLHKAFYELKKQDREWVENIKQTQIQFWAGEIQLEPAILYLTMLFSNAIGRPSPRRRVFNASTEQPNLILVAN
jgi:hypothetical protein